MKKDPYMKMMEAIIINIDKSIAKLNFFSTYLFQDKIRHKNIATQKNRVKYLKLLIPNKVRKNTNNKKKTKNTAILAKIFRTKDIIFIFLNCLRPPKN